MVSLKIATRERGNWGVLSPAPTLAQGFVESYPRKLISGNLATSNQQPVKKGQKPNNKQVFH